MRIKATIPASDTKSGVLDIRGYKESMGLTFPAAFDGTSMTFEGADKPDQTFRPVMDDAGVAISITVAQQDSVALSEAKAHAVMSFNYIKLVSGSTETAQRVVPISLK